MSNYDASGAALRAFTGSAEATKRMYDVAEEQRKEKLREAMSNMDPNNLDINAINAIDPVAAQDVRSGALKYRAGQLGVAGEEQDLASTISKQAMGAWEHATLSGEPDSPELRNHLLNTANAKLQESGLPPLDLNGGWEALMGQARGGGYIPFAEKLKMEIEKQRSLTGVDVERFRQMQDARMPYERQRLEMRDKSERDMIDYRTQKQGELISQRQNAPQPDSLLAVPPGEEPDADGLYPSDEERGKAFFYGVNDQLAPGSGKLGVIVRMRTQRALNRWMSKNGLTYADMIKARGARKGLDAASVQTAKTRHAQEQAGGAAYKQIAEVRNIHDKLKLTNYPDLNKGILTMRERFGGKDGGQDVAVYRQKLGAIRMDWARIKSNTASGAWPPVSFIEQAEKEIPEGIGTAQLEELANNLYSEQLTLRQGLREEQVKIEDEYNRLPGYNDQAMGGPVSPPQIYPGGGGEAELQDPERFGYTPGQPTPGSPGVPAPAPAPQGGVPGGSEEEIKAMWKRGEISDQEVVLMLRQLHGMQ